MASAQDRPAPGRRDPEGRRRAIIAAAAEIITEPGTALTHRAVAARAGVSLGSTTQYFASLEDLRATALSALADEIDAGIAGVAQELLPIESEPERCAELVHELLLDARQVRADMALMTAAVADPGLRDLAVRWTERLADLLAQHVGRAQAEAIVLYLDGVWLHAALHDTPVTAAEMAATIRTLMTIPSEGSDPR